MRKEVLSVEKQKKPKTKEMHGWIFFFVVSKDLFNVLKEKYGASLQTFLAEKVTLVAGDITHDNLGVHDSLLCQQMWRDVDVVVNVAASTVFNERYDVALALNTYGAKFVMDFAIKCVNIKLLLHVSTAYVSGNKPGLILETPYYLGDTLNEVNGLDIKQEKMIIEDTLNKLKFDRDANDKTITLAMKDLGMQRANHYGWPNTYVFTKALGEMILGHSRGDMPLVIFRPTIITSTYKEPFPGWIEGIRTGDSLIVGYGKGRMNCFLGEPDSVYDAVPADMVVNAMLVTIVANANQSFSQKIYHVGSSVSNPLKFSIVQKCGYLYFTQNPWIDNDGKPVTVGKVTVLKSIHSFHRYITIRYLLPLCLLKVVNVIFCKAFAGTYNNLKRKIDLVQKLVKLYEPYLFSKSLYDDTNTEKLRKAVIDSETKDFYFDPRIIDWEDYFLHTHIPGLVKYEFE
nr:fatty acyl-CoA reductase 3-like [Tanacetum cinerariifolium]